MSLVSNSALSFVQLLKKKEWVAKNKMKTKEEGNILLNRQFVLVQRAAGAQSTGFLLLEKTDPPSNSSTRSFLQLQMAKWDGATPI